MGVHKMYNELLLAATIAKVDEIGISLKNGIEME